MNGKEELEINRETLKTDITGPCDFCMMNMRLYSFGGHLMCLACFDMERWKSGKKKYE
jgi:hypothetical protein|tara:strand:- start:1158 stop:1331 length:174 start_codon:yes stop_codon:yes gene_type:complete